jgi:FHA domain
MEAVREASFAPEPAPPPKLLEFATRSGQVLARVPCRPGSLQIGRALKSDVVIDDPFIAATHLRIEIDASGAVRVADAGSVNGLFDGLGRKARRVQHLVLADDQPVKFGHTTLRLRDLRSQVEPERPEGGTQLAGPLFSAPVAALLIAALALWSLTETWLGNFAVLKPAQLITAASGLIVSFFFWVGGWALVTRVFTGHARFAAHAAIAGWSVLAWTVIDLVLHAAGFAFSTQVPGMGKPLIGAALVLWTLLRHLRLAQVRWPRLNVPLATLLVALPLAGLTFNTWDTEHSLLPLRTPQFADPALKLGSTISSAAFVQDAQSLKPMLEPLRKLDEDGEDAFED